jgi:hypothetical protein
VAGVRAQKDEQHNDADLDSSENQTSDNPE